MKAKGIDVYTDDLSLSFTKLEEYAARHSIRWPRTGAGRLATDKNTMKELDKAYPSLCGPLKAAFSDLGAMKLREFTIGSDGRNRTYLNPFGSITGRNQPSNSKCLFFAAAWLRPFITPPPGRALAYIDWGSQEVAIAAGRSGDTKLQKSYESGDVYLGFLKEAQLVPPDATKQSHAAERDAAKAMVLGNQFGMGAGLMAERMGKEG